MLIWSKDDCVPYQISQVVYDKRMYNVCLLENYIDTFPADESDYYAITEVYEGDRLAFQVVTPYTKLHDMLYDTFKGALTASRAWMYVSRGALYFVAYRDNTHVNSRLVKRKDGATDRAINSYISEYDAGHVLNERRRRYVFSDIGEHALEVYNEYV